MTRHLLINSNKWFSAVTDYSLQLARYLRDEGVDVVAHQTSPLLEKVSSDNSISMRVLPLIPSGPVAFIKCWFLLGSLLKAWKETGGAIIWTFEGREHTLCALHRVFHKKIWTDLKLIRVRGQAQVIRPHFLNKWLYLRATDKVIFAASAVARLAPFYFSRKQAMVQYYCVRSAEHPKKIETFSFLKNVPEIDFSKPVFLIVGRFDPVKGHREFLQTFASVDFANKPVQLVIIGQSKNIYMKDLFELAQTLLKGHGTFQGTRAFASDGDGLRRIYFFDEHLSNINEFMASSHFGVVPSLGSEVICRVAVEFLQVGTPLIASFVGALGEVLAGAPGRVVSATSTRQWQEALQWAVDKVGDQKDYAKMRKNCFTLGHEKFDLNQFKKMTDFVQE